MIVVLAALLVSAVDQPAAEPPPLPASVVDNKPEAFLMPPRSMGSNTDSAEDIAEDSARDLTDNRYYNKPGATRAEYDTDWQECRLIARGSMTPGGSYVVVYNPAVISPAAAAGGGLIGGLIASAIIEGQVRRANRRACLMFKGWRVVEVEAETGARYAAMSEAARTTILNEALGAAEPKGKSVQSWSNAFAEMPAALVPKAVK